MIEKTQTPQQTQQAQQTPQAQAFIDYLYAGIAEATETWDARAARDIYVVWILLALHEDDARFAEVTAVGYGTTAHTTPELEKSYGSKWNPGCWAGGSDLNLCHPSDAEYADIYGIEDKHDAAGLALRDAYLDAVVTRFDRSDAERERLFEHSNLQHRRDHSPGQFTPEEQIRLEELNQSFSVTDAERAALEDDDRHLFGLYHEAVLGPILHACASVIGRLHAGGVLERKCGHPVPATVTFSNDMDARVALEATQWANPPGLARGLEEWMMGYTYEQADAQQELVREVAAKSPQEQAAFWAEVLVGGAESPYLGRQTPLLERLQAIAARGAALLPLAAGSPEVHAAVVPHLVTLLIGEIEEHASAAVLTVPCPAPPAGDGVRGAANDVALSLLLSLQSLVRTPSLRDAVRDEDVERLHRLLSRLFRDSESIERVSMTTSVVARTLHALRPYRFPADKFGSGGETANRLLNYRAFGLRKSDPTTPDYDEAADEARRAARRQARIEGRIH